MTKLEEVARAICCPDGCIYKRPNDCYAPRSHVSSVRAAITALMELTPAMRVAAATWDDFGSNYRAALQSVLDQQKGEQE